MKFLNALKAWWAIPPQSHLIKCPVCNTTKLAQEAGLASYQRPFVCENGHYFSVPIEGP